MKLIIKLENGYISPHSMEDKQKLNELKSALYEVDINNMDMRTIKQNSALHLWCTQIASVLNENNIYMTGLFENDIIWTRELVKTQIVKGLIDKLFNIKSTTKLRRAEIDTLVDTIISIFGEKKGVVIPDFPNRELWDEKQKGK